MSKPGDEGRYIRCWDSSSSSMVKGRCCVQVDKRNGWGVMMTWSNHTGNRPSVSRTLFLSSLPQLLYRHYHKDGRRGTNDLTFSCPFIRATMQNVLMTMRTPLSK